MTARDDYRELANLAKLWTGTAITAMTTKGRQMERALDEIDRLRTEVARLREQAAHFDYWADGTPRR